MDWLISVQNRIFTLRRGAAETKNEALPANMDGLAKLTTVSYLSLSAAKIQMILPHATKIQKISRTTKTPHAGSSASKTILTILFPHASRHLTTTIPDFPLLINSTRQDDVKTKQEQIQLLVLVLTYRQSTISSLQSKHSTKPKTQHFLSVFDSCVKRPCSTEQIHSLQRQHKILGCLIPS